MRLVGLIVGQVLLAGIAHVAADDTLPPPIVWRENVFAIPYRVNRTPTAVDAPVNVQLFVSVDQGQTWTHSKTLDPQPGSFTFQADRDGEYWFSLRTVDRRGRVLPEGPHRCELRVIVDTLAPRLELTGKLGDDGEVLVEWHVADPNLNKESLKIELLAGGAWQPLAIGKAPASAGRSVLQGRTSWLPPRNCESVVIRAEVHDLAKNPAEIQKKVDLSARAKTAAKLGDRGVVAADEQPLYGTLPYRPPLTHSPTHQTSNPSQASNQWPPDRVGQLSLDRSIADGELSGDTHADASKNQTDARSGFAGLNAGTSPWQSAKRWLPRGVQLILINSDTFDLDYELTPVGTAGIGKVELWGTRDGGQTWTSYGVDNDNRTPIRVHVPVEGIVGFRVIVQSGTGVGGNPPKSGDLPERWVGVDMTRPVAKILETRPMSQSQADKLQIFWEASDENLAPSPISLSYSRYPGGPWSKIANALDNTGHYTWSPSPETLPDQLYLRLVVRDAAGNTGTFHSIQPVALSVQTPTARIRDVRRTARSDRTGIHHPTNLPFR